MFSKKKDFLSLEENNGPVISIIANDFDDGDCYINEKDLKEGCEKIKEIQERYNNISIEDKSKIFNTDLMEAIELKNLIDSADTTIRCALNRTESRGAHSREDYPDRDDVNWLKHSFITKSDSGEPEITYKPVVIGKYKPMERKY